MPTYTAPHFPLQVPPSYIARYEGVYDAGYDTVRDARLSRMRMMGLIAPDLVDAPIPPDAIPWSGWPSSEEHKLDALRMQAYAGMVDYMDEQIGRVLDYLDNAGELDNTLIFFASDNGAAPGWNPPVFADHGGKGPDNSAANIGSPGSYLSQGTGWAWVSSAPFKRHKETADEGGHSVPAIAVLPGSVAAGSISDTLITVRDLLPTFLDAADAEFPATNGDGQPTVPLQGRSVLPVLEGDAGAQPHAGEAIGFDSGPVQYMFKDQWKIVMGSDKHWELYDLSADRAEQTDLAAANPERLQDMISAWDDYEALVAGQAAKPQ